MRWRQYLNPPFNSIISVLSRCSTWAFLNPADVALLLRISAASRSGARVAECGFPDGPGTEQQLAP